MLRVALTGGLASGKSFVGHHLEGLGCLLVQADALGHEVLNAEARAGILEEFGSGILKEEGTIDRRKLAAEAFTSPERLERLNRLVHPYVRRRVEDRLAEFASREPKGIAVVEAAIHIETGGYRNFDRIVLAYCSPDQQMQRAIHRDQTSRAEVESRLKRQMPLERKRKFAHYVIDTSGSKDSTRTRTLEVYQELRRIPQ